MEDLTPDTSGGLMARLDAWLPRLWKTMILAALALALLLWFWPQQGAVIFSKDVIIIKAAIIGYWLDRAFFPYARPDTFKEGSVYIGAMIRRVILVAAVIIAYALAA